MSLCPGRARAHVAPRHAASRADDSRVGKRSASGLHLSSTMPDIPWYMRPNDPAVEAAAVQLETLRAFEVESARIARLLRERLEGDWLEVVDALETNGILHAHVQQRELRPLHEALDRVPVVAPREVEELEQFVVDDTATVLAETLARGGALYERALASLVAPRATRGMLMAHRADLHKLQQAYEERARAINRERLEGHPAAE